jgi:hypothetical protein
MRILKPYGYVHEGELRKNPHGTRELASGERWIVLGLPTYRDPKPAGILAYSLRRGGVNLTNMNQEFSRGERWNSNSRPIARLFKRR